MKRTAIIICLFLATASAAAAGTCASQNSIIKVSNTRVGLRELVKFQVKAPLTGSFAITAGSGPTFIQDGSGNPVSVRGNRWTDVVFRNMDWMCSARTRFALPKPVVKDIKNIGQFEGQIEYVIGRRNGHYLGHAVSTAGGITTITLKYGP
jgi:hypothetical protein